MRTATIGTHGNSIWELMRMHQASFEERRIVSPAGCQAEKPRNRKCDVDLKTVEVMTAWSLEALETKPQFTECLTDSLEEARIERWTRQVWGKAGKKACHPVPKDDFVWLLARNISHRGIGRKSSGTSIQECLVWLPCRAATALVRLFGGVLPPLPWTSQAFLGGGHHGQQRASSRW